MESGFLIAIFLVVVTFSMPAFSRELRKNGAIMFVYWVLIALHQVVAFLNQYLYADGIGEIGVVGAASDANQGFHHIAKELALSGELLYRGVLLSVPLSPESFLKGGSFYYEMLGSFYKWFGVSHLLGEQLSILVFAFSCIIFLKIMRQLGLEHYRVSCLFCFGALPTMVLLGSVTLRESFEVFFFMLAVYLGVKISISEKLHIASIFYMIIAALLMGVFHKALVIYAIFMIFLFLVYSVRPVSRWGNIKKLHLIAVGVIPFIFLCLMLISAISFLVIAEKDLNALIYIKSLIGDILIGNNNFFDHIISYRKLSLLNFGRTSYVVPLDGSSIFMMIYSLLKGYSYYLLKPFPWEIYNALDTYAFLEVLIRTTLVCFLVFEWRKAVGLRKRLLGLMLLLFFSMSFLWATGTTNYGTAIRHNMLTWWIIVIGGVPPLIKKLHFYIASYVSSNECARQVDSS